MRVLVYMQNILLNQSAFTLTFGNVLDEVKILKGKFVYKTPQRDYQCILQTLQNNENLEAKKICNFRLSDNSL